MSSKGIQPFEIFKKKQTRKSKLINTVIADEPVDYDYDNII